MGAGPTLRDAIDRADDERSASPFLIALEGDFVASFGAVRRRCRALAQGLGERGLAPGDRVAILLENGLFTTELFLGCLYGGFVPTPIAPTASGAEIDWVLEHSGARVCFASADAAPRIRDAVRGAAPPLVAAEPDCGPGWVENDFPLPGVDADAPAVLDYTSGSTGRPKGVLVTHGALLAGARNTVRAHALDSRDRSLCVGTARRFGRWLLRIAGCDRRRPRRNGCRGFRSSMKTSARWCSQQPEAKRCSRIRPSIIS
jgi:acyl-CoA synthetase (AMP-forming)/AMP-acid ligase II